MRKHSVPVVRQMAKQVVRAGLINPQDRRLIIFYKTLSRRTGLSVQDCVNETFILARGNRYA